VGYGSAGRGGLLVHPTNHAHTHTRARKIIVESK
jgi:hypothetical protein